MKFLMFQKGAGIFLCLSMVSGSAQSAYAPLSLSTIANDAVSGTASGDLNAAPADAMHHSDEMNSNIGRSTPISTETLPLPKTLISMDFQDADIRDVMHLMAVKSSLNIIYGADVTGPISVHLDQVPFDQAFQTVLTLKGLVALPVGARIIRVVSSTGLSTEQAQAATFTKVFVLKYGNAPDLKAPIDAIRSASGRKGVTSVDAKSNSIIITDTLEGLQQVGELIPSLDRKPQQVDIEAKIVEVTLDNSTALGVSWQYAGTVEGQVGPNKPYSTVGQTIQTQLPTGPGTSGNLLGVVNSPVTPALGGAGVDFLSNLGSVSQSGFSFLTSRGTYLLSAQLTALATQNRVKILSTPHVVTLNNVEANINVINKIPYQVSTVSNGTVSNNVQFVDAGVKLDVKPTVNADRRITLLVKPEVSNAGAATFTGGPPQINSRNAETTVLLRDGETIAIGGLITENNQKIVTGIPILMSIPILGYLFKGTSDRLTRTELIVFLTPKIAAE